MLTRVAFAKSVALSASSLFGSVSICNICVPCDKEMQKGTDMMHSSQGGAPCVHIGWVAREKNGLPRFLLVLGFSWAIFDESSFVLNQLVIGKNPQANPPVGKKFKKSKIKKGLTSSGWVTYAQAKSLSTGFVTPETRGSRIRIQRGANWECSKGKGIDFAASRTDRIYNERIQIEA